jgi:hypothetical protein
MFLHEDNLKTLQILTSICGYIITCGGVFLMQGHCKALFLSIERLLGVLRVDRVVLPAAEGAEGIWLNKFGFSKMANDQVCLYCLYVELTRFFPPGNKIIALTVLCVVSVFSSSCLLAWGSL